MRRERSSRGESTFYAGGHAPRPNCARTRPDKSAVAASPGMVKVSSRQTSYCVFSL